MLCLLHTYLLFRFNMAASGARIPRIFNHKRMLTSYLMGVSSILIKELWYNRLSGVISLFLVACNTFFSILYLKKGVDLYAGLEFFLHIGVKIWGVDLYVQSTYTRVYTVCCQVLQPGSSNIIALSITIMRNGLAAWLQKPMWLVHNVLCAIFPLFIIGSMLSKMTMISYLKSGYQLL